jgi:hypothetical protein
VPINHARWLCAPLLLLFSLSHTRSYAVMPKIVNFMAPAVRHDESFVADELFASLFGGAGVAVEPGLSGAGSGGTGASAAGSGSSAGSGSGAGSSAASASGSAGSAVAGSWSSGAAAKKAKAVAAAAEPEIEDY